MVADSFQDNYTNSECLFPHSIVGFVSFCFALIILVHFILSVNIVF